MIPLHLKTTTVHVDAAQAERLVQARAAEWLPGANALVTGSRPDDAALALLRSA